jgi:hypothetical protein
MAVVGAASQALWVVGLGPIAAVLGVVLGLTARLELMRHEDGLARRLRILADVVLALGLVGLFVVGLLALD